MAPKVRRIWKTVQQHNRNPCAGIDDVKVDSIRPDLLAGGHLVPRSALRHGLRIMRPATWSPGQQLRGLIVRRAGVSRGSADTLELCGSSLNTRVRLPLTSRLQERDSLDVVGLGKHVDQGLRLDLETE